MFVIVLMSYQIKPGIATYGAYGGQTHMTSNHGDFALMSKDYFKPMTSLLWSIFIAN